MSDHVGGRSVQQRLIALGGLAAIVGVAVLLLWVGGVLGDQGGGEGIEDVLLLDTPRAQGRGELEVGPERGKLAPDFEISDFDGERYRLSDFRGQVVLVNFWATWCVSCLFELPELAALQERHGDDIVVLLVNRRERTDLARDYLRNDVTRLDGGTGAEFAIEGVDPTDGLFDRYQSPNLMPASYFVDPDGVIAAVAWGPLKLEQMEIAYERALARDPEFGG